VANYGELVKFRHRSFFLWGKEEKRMKPPAAEAADDDMSPRGGGGGVSLPLQPIELHDINRSPLSDDALSPSGDAVEERRGSIGGGEGGFFHQSPPTPDSSVSESHHKHSQKGNIAHHWSRGLCG
jgi:hypothetical protein